MFAARIGEDRVYVSANGVIHQARIWPHSCRAALACNASSPNPSVLFGSPQLREDGEYSEALARWLTEQTGRPHSLCYHCANCQPSWERDRAQFGRA